MSASVIIPWRRSAFTLRSIVGRKNSVVRLDRFSLDPSLAIRARYLGPLCSVLTWDAQTLRNLRAVRISSVPYARRKRVAKYMYRFLVASLGARRLFSMPRQYNHVYFYLCVYTHEIFFGSSREPLFFFMQRIWKMNNIKKMRRVNVIEWSCFLDRISCHNNNQPCIAGVFVFFFPGRKLVTITYKTSIEINLMHVLVQNAECCNSVLVT